MKRLSEILKSFLPPGGFKPQYYGVMQTIRAAELKPGDTLIVSFPQIIHGLPQDEADKIEAQVRKDLKVPDGVNLTIFFSPVDFYHLKKV